MKKKILLMSLAVSVVLSACGGSAGNGKAGEKAEISEKLEAETESGAEEEGADDAVSTKDSAPEAGGAKEGALEKSSEDDYAKGTVSETGWESEFLGLRYTAPEGMGMATEEFLAEMTGIGKEILSDSFTEQQLKYAEMRTVYEMMSLDAEGGTGFNVLVMAEKLPLINMSIAQYVSSFVQQLSAVEGATLLGDDETAEIAEEEYWLVRSKVEAQGNSVNQNYYFRVLGDRAMSIVISYTDDTADRIDTVLDAFEAYEKSRP